VVDEELRRPRLGAYRVIDLYLDSADDNTQRARLGAELRFLREAKGLRADVAAKSSGMSESYLRMIERGDRQPPPSRLVALLETLGWEQVEPPLSMDRFVRPETRAFTFSADDVTSRVALRFEEGAAVVLVRYRPEARYRMDPSRFRRLDSDTRAGDLPPDARRDLMLGALTRELAANPKLLRKLYAEYVERPANPDPASRGRDGE
jgi:transcriptional regulator with XRE-family HTH domain